MPETKNVSAVKQAVLLGGLCSIAYLAVYIVRNILGAVSPQIEAAGILTKEHIGTLSSVYFICYAVGQLINGMTGDRIKSKYMICMGLLGASICNLFLPLLSHSPAMVNVVYGATGYFLSMIYGPMTKLIAENVEPHYATRCSLGYTFSSFLGSPLAGLMAAAMNWQIVFYFGSGILMVMAFACFFAFSILERSGRIGYGKYRPEKSSGNIRVLLKHRIVKFTLIAVLTGIVRTTVVFWLTTYLTEYLHFSADTSALIFTIATLVISAAAFLAVFVYERCGNNMDLTLLLSFGVSALGFLLAYLFPQPILNICCMIVAILTANCAASMLWSRYCPSLRDTGMVSGATGFLDFMSYMAAAVSSTLFANAVSDIGWKNLILIWFVLMGIGTIVSLPFDQRKRNP